MIYSEKELEKQSTTTLWGAVGDVWEIYPEPLIYPEKEPEEQNMQEPSEPFEIYIQSHWQIHRKSQRGAEYRPVLQAFWANHIEVLYEDLNILDKTNPGVFVDIQRPERLHSAVDSRILIFSAFWDKRQNRRTSLSRMVFWGRGRTERHPIVQVYFEAHSKHPLLVCCFWSRSKTPS
jgi:hypothetical protein